MRLLTRNTTGVLTLISVRDEDVPEYAILSHTWTEDQEVTYDEFVHGNGKSKSGYRKIMFCMEQAEKDGLQHCWVDTCCINKATSDELTTAINSMFRWYRDAAKCYVLMSDVRIPEHVEEPAEYPVTWLNAFKRSRWFTRGWTLQELLAPATVDFYAEDCRHFGDKISLEREIHNVTGIETAALRGKPLSEFSVEERMAWVKGRNTTLKEDSAYCLLGIFGIYMPLIYGEGHNAFVRLQLEVEKSEARHDQSPKQKLLSHTLPPTEQLSQVDRKARELQRQLEKRERLLEQLKEVHNQLRFGEMDHRYADIKLAHTRTCEWLIGTDEYQQWMREEWSSGNSCLLWIKGKPGSGKSTLTKFALVRTTESRPDDILLSFFFNARGSRLEKTVNGLYRSLLWHLLDREENCMNVLEVVRSAVMAQRDTFPWKTAILQELLTRAILLLKRRSFLVVVDALDECDEDEVRDMITLFTELGDRCRAEGIMFRVLLSSRYYPQITCPSSIELRLDQQDGHFDDIQKYVEAALNVGTGRGSQDLRDEICRRASGVFIWVVLVVRILNKEHDRGRALTMRKHLDRLPADLGELFKDIITREVDDIEEMKVCIQWVLYASAPLHPAELYFAILAAVDPDGVDDHWRADVSATTIAMYITNTSRGLTEISPDTARVQMIHESVRDFFFGDNQLPQTWHQLQRISQGEAHDRLKLVCKVFIAAFTNAVINPYSPPGRFGFCQYAVTSMFIHAEKAQAHHIDQTHFLTNLDTQRWAEVHSCVTNYAEDTKNLYVGLSGPITQLLLVLAGNNCHRLIELVLQLHTLVDINPPFFQALSAGHYESMAALCRAGLNSHPHAKSEPCYCTQWPGESQLLKVKTFVPTASKHALHFLIEEGQLSLACCLVTSHGLDVNVINSRNQTALMLAAGKGYHELAAMISGCANADIGAKDVLGQTALMHAAMEGHLEMVRLLLNLSGADADARDGDGMTAMSHAARKGYFTIVQVLLEKGAATNTPVEADGPSAIELASEAGHARIVELLYANGAHLGQCLQMASRNGHLPVIEFLLAQGHDVNALDRGGRTALYAASATGEWKAVKILIANGAQLDFGFDATQTPLRVAFVGNHQQVVDQLYAAGVTDTFNRCRFDFLANSLEEVM